MSEERAKKIIAYIEKGLHCFSIGQFEEARSYWNQVLELDPRNEQAIEFLQYVASPQGGSGIHGEPSVGSWDGVPKANPSDPGPLSMSQSGAVSWNYYGNKAPSSSYLPQEAWLPQEEDLSKKKADTNPPPYVEPPLPNATPLPPEPLPPSNPYRPFHETPSSSFPKASIAPGTPFPSDPKKTIPPASRVSLPSYGSAANPPSPGFPPPSGSWKNPFEQPTEVSAIPFTDPASLLPSSPSMQSFHSNEFTGGQSDSSFEQPSLSQQAGMDPFAPQIGADPLGQSEMNPTLREKSPFQDASMLGEEPFEDPWGEDEKSGSAHLRDLAKTSPPASRYGSGSGHYGSVMEANRVPPLTGSGAYESSSRSMDYLSTGPHDSGFFPDEPLSQPNLPSLTGELLSIKQGGEVSRISPSEQQAQPDANSQFSHEDLEFLLGYSSEYEYPEEIAALRVQQEQAELESQKSSAPPFPAGSGWVVSESPEEENAFSEPPPVLQREPVSEPVDFVNAPTDSANEVGTDPEISVPSALSEAVYESEPFVESSNPFFAPKQSPSDSFLSHSPPVSDPFEPMAGAPQKEASFGFEPFSPMKPPKPISEPIDEVASLKSEKLSSEDAWSEHLPPLEGDIGEPESKTPLGQDAPVFDMPSSLAKDSQPAMASPQQDDLAILLSGVEDLFGEEDYVTAKELLESALRQEPDNEKAQELYEKCEKKLQVHYAKIFTSLNMVPKMQKDIEDVLNLQLNHRAGFILSQIDGRTTLSELMILSTMKKEEIFLIVGHLMDQGVISVAPPK